MLVSFVVTVYNKAKYLKAVVDSLSSQVGDFEKEVIFVNDGSTDESVQVIQNSANHLTNYQIINKPNEGPAKALNVGVRAAKGRYIKFVDGDDYLLPNSTLNLLEALQKGSGDVAFGRMGESYHPDSISELDKLILSNSSNTKMDAYEIRSPLKKVITGRFSGISNLGGSRGFASHNAIKNINGADEAVFVQDYSLSLRLAATCKVIYIDHVIYLTGNNLDDNLSFNTVQERHDTILALYEFTKHYPTQAHQYRKEIYLKAARNFKKIIKEKNIENPAQILKWSKLGVTILPPSLLEIRSQLEEILKWLQSNFKNELRLITSKLDV